MAPEDEEAPAGDQGGEAEAGEGHGGQLHHRGQAPQVAGVGITRILWLWLFPLRLGVFVARVTMVRVFLIF